MALDTVLTTSTFLGTRGWFCKGQGQGKGKGKGRTGSLLMKQALADQQTSRPAPGVTRCPIDLPVGCQDGAKPLSRPLEGPQFTQLVLPGVDVEDGFGIVRDAVDVPYGG